MKRLIDILLGLAIAAIAAAVFPRTVADGRIGATDEMTNGNDSAFARSGFAISPEDYDTGESGLTKREYFAAMAMQAFCSHPVMGEHAEPDEIAATAVEQADALIDELNKEK